jgi:hypothetical protein
VLPEPVAVALDVDDLAVVQQTVEVNSVMAYKVLSLPQPRSEKNHLLPVASTGVATAACYSLFSISVMGITTPEYLQIVNLNLKDRTFEIEKISNLPQIIPYMVNCG